ncbi:MAG: glycosyltransferase family 87 protein [Thermoleophilia bacterium]
MAPLKQKIMQVVRAKWLIGFFVISGALCAGLLMLEFTNRYNGGIWLRDFQVFYRAGSRALTGDELFRPVRDGYYSYKYSPTASLIFIPFSLIPFAASEVIYWLFISALVLAGFYLSLEIIFPDFRNADPRELGLLLVLAAVILGVHIWSELTLGQVNHLLLVMYVAIAYLFTRHRPVLLAFIWALSIFIKPFGLILLPYFAIKKKFREIAWFSGFSAFLFFLPALSFRGNFLNEQRYWFEEMALELRMKADVFQPGNKTLVSVIAQFSPVKIIEPGSSYLILYKIVVLTMVTLLAVVLIRRGSGLQRPEVLDFAFILALTPLISYTSNNLFGMVELAVFLLLFNFGKLKTWEKITAGVGFLLIGGNFYNQLPFEWGVRFYEYYDQISLLSIGTILLLATIFMVRWRETL